VELLSFPNEGVHNVKSSHYRCRPYKPCLKRGCQTLARTSSNRKSF